MLLLYRRALFSLCALLLFQTCCRSSSMMHEFIDTAVVTAVRYAMTLDRRGKRAAAGGHRALSCCCCAVMMRHTSICVRVYIIRVKMIPCDTGACSVLIYVWYHPTIRLVFLCCTCRGYCCSAVCSSGGSVAQVLFLSLCVFVFYTGCMICTRYVHLHMYTISVYACM